MLPIVRTLLQLELGIKLHVNSKDTDDIKFYLINAVFDKPARASVLKMIASNGFYGCLKCTQRGETLPPSEKSMKPLRNLIR